MPGAITAATVREAVAAAHRSEWGAVVAATARLTGELDLAEECAQEAFARAVELWPERGIPDRPGAWLTTVAANHARDLLRRQVALRRRLPLLVRDEVTDDDAAVRADDRLRLIFMCCHPALAREAQVALTLRLVCGVATVDIARAFLVTEQTMAARITRAKRKIAAAHIPFRMPDVREMPARTSAVCDVLYLAFTVGHASPGESSGRDLVAAALALTRMLQTQVPRDRSVAGLLALMLLIDARRATRDRLLPDQDRSLWDRAQVEEGLAMLGTAAAGPVDRFAISAAIAAVHAQARTWEATDWGRIVDLYDVLGEAWPSPVVELNRAVAIGMRDGPQAGLAAIEAVRDAPALDRYAYLPAARAAFLAGSERWAEAAAEYDRAAGLTASLAERARLQEEASQARSRA
ncbi:RNA polymerase sigma factor [Microbacterium timonense]|uniref:RNA polymerase sigma factor n=1 Tax=Microbacterium timonense TaxID=2086576 RepID=UPI001F170C92|nr:DUF6596 domain-containing protein [Microbacterium timonense]